MDYTTAIFNSSEFFTNGKLEDTLDYNWILNLDPKSKYEIATQMLKQGKFLWILSDIGVIHFYNVLIKYIDSIFVQKLTFHDTTHLKQEMMNDELFYLLRHHISEFYNIKCVLPNDIQSIRVIDIELELYHHRVEEK